MNKRLVILLSMVSLLLLAATAMAFNAPAQGDFAFDLYDIAVNDVLKGPIGFVGAILAFVTAAVLAIRQMIVPAVGTVLGGVFLLKADALITGLGALIL
ncbi:hypothetical protein [Geoalkalibacter sp.]|uniref:hypothetical protein n=1 Tax=Geoalkalibacter sp. TaxID=3041440 RepID=UPI00272E8A26|nr:hypothetical protein [Geoalkalibacter sp.]